MMKNYKGVLPGQRVFQWDRLEEFKDFKKARGEISEIKADPNESVLSRESDSLANQSLFRPPRDSRIENEVTSLVLGNSVLRERKASFQFEVENLEMPRGAGAPPKMNFKKKMSIPEIRSPDGPGAGSLIATRKAEAARPGKSGGDLERWA